MIPSDIARELRELASLAEAVADGVSDVIATLARVYVDVLRGGGTLYFAGNGGSAADAQHVAAEYVVRFKRARRGFAAVALTTDTSILTACGNDFSFEDIFARQIEALGQPGDALILHSTSGRSPNLRRAVEVAQAKHLTTVALLGGDGGALRDVVDHAVLVPSRQTSHIQELHLAIEHIVCDLVERGLSEGDGPVA